MRQIILARHRGGGDGDRPLHLLREVAQRDRRVFAHLQDLLGVLIEELACVGRVGLLRRADNELDIQFSLQCGDMRADGRLRQVQQLRGAGKAAILHHVDERFKLLDIHINVHKVLPSKPAAQGVLRCRSCVVIAQRLPVIDSVYIVSCTLSRETANILQELMHFLLSESAMQEFGQITAFPAQAPPSARWRAGRGRRCF